jgi:hypothetical protein
MGTELMAGSLNTMVEPLGLRPKPDCVKTIFNYRKMLVLCEKH